MEFDRGCASGGVYVLYIYSHCQVRVTVADWDLGCCVHATSFDNLVVVFMRRLSILVVVFMRRLSILVVVFMRRLSILVVVFMRRLSILVVMFITNRLSSAD